MTRVHNRRMNQQIVVDELGGTRAVGKNSTDRSGNEVDGIGAILFEPVVDRGLIAEIELITSGGKRRDSVFVQPPDDRRAHKTAVACDKHV